MESSRDGDVPRRFSGVPFGAIAPYDADRARGILRAAMRALRERSDLVEELGIDPYAPGRGHIRDDPREGVWDFLQLREADTEGRFSACPHLTLNISRDRVFAESVLPNAMRRVYQSRLCSLTLYEFRDLLVAVTTRMMSALGSARGFFPWIEVLQRHYATPNSPVLDARLDFDPRTIPGSDTTSTRRSIKPNASWVSAAYDAVISKGEANVQLAIGAMFPYDKCPAVHTPEALDLFAQTWLACKPVLDRIVRAT